MAPKLLAATRVDHCVRTENEIRLVVSCDLAAGAWGSGVLTYEGNDYPFDVSGLMVGDIDHSAELSGEVLNLRNLEDFKGNYARFHAEDAVAGPTGGATLKNEKGVIISVVPKREGGDFETGFEIMRIELRNKDKLREEERR